MAIIKATHTYELSAINIGEGVTLVPMDGNTLIRFKDGKEITLLDLINRVEALETAYMELKLLDSDPVVK